MTSTGEEQGSLLRALPPEGARPPVLTRAGHVVHAARRLGELVHRRPSGVTGHQWNVAVREGYDFVVCAADSGRPVFAVEVGPPPAADSAGQRAERMKNAVAGAAGLTVLAVGSPTLRADDHGRRIIAYVIDARGYAEGAPEETGPRDASLLGYRDILGRLPDGRTGYVNDLGALARAAAVEAYVSGRLVDPIVRGLHVRWKGGPAEGWSWVEVRPGACLLERVTVHEHRFWSGVDADRFAEDLAAMAVGERLRGLDDAEPVLVSRRDLLGEIRRLAARRDDLANGFAFDHLCLE